MSDAPDMDEEVRYAVQNVLRHLRDGNADSAAVYAHSVHGDWVDQFGQAEADIMAIAVQTGIDGTEFAGFESPPVQRLAPAPAPEADVIPGTGGRRVSTAMIRQQTQEIERAIHNHPPKTVGVYETAMRSWGDGAARLEQSDWMRSLGLSTDEMRDVHHFLLAASFISAWHRRHGNKPKAREAAAAYLPIAETSGLPFEEVVGRYAQYEDAWMQAFRESGVGSSPLGCLLLIIGLAVATWLVLR